MGYLDIVFNAPPGPDSNFVELEINGRAIRLGSWRNEGDLWVLRIPALELAGVLL